MFTVDPPIRTNHRNPSLGLISCIRWCDICCGQLFATHYKKPTSSTGNIIEHHPDILHVEMEGWNLTHRRQGSGGRGPRVISPATRDIL